VPLGLSIGFAEVPGGSRWTTLRGGTPRVTRTRAQLDHVAVVRQGAYAGALVAGVRGYRMSGCEEVPLSTLARLRLP